MSLGTANLLLNILTALILPLSYFVWKQVQYIRENDLKHLDEKHHEILTRLIQVDEKLDRHLDFSESIHRQMEHRLSSVEGMRPGHE